MPDASPITLLLIDVINDFEHEDGARLLAHARPASERIAALAAKARAAGVPVIYVNDNFGRWRDDFEALVEHALASPGREVAENLRPEPGDFFILKPMHSAFYESSLETLLERLETEALVLTGFAGDICVLATAMDAHMRDYRLVIPRDGVASVEPEHSEAALAYARRVFGAATPAVAEVDFDALREGG